MMPARGARAWNRRRLAWGVFGSLMLLVGPSWGDELRQVIAPAAAENVEGDTHLIFPWDCAISADSLRQQQVYQGTAIGVGEIVEIRFRQDADLGQAFGPVLLSNATIRLSTTEQEIDLLSPVFANNLGADARIVFQGDLSLASASSVQVPRPFDVVVPLQTPFPFTGSVTEHLLLDVTLPACASTTALDATLVVGDEVARIWETQSTATVASRADTVGLVTEFVLRYIFTDDFESGNLSRWTTAFP